MISSDIERRRRKQASLQRFAGFADATPSESIQYHNLPGLAVGSLFPYKSDEILLEVPVKQYKDVKGIRKKNNSAQKLITWLKQKKSEGLIIEGFCSTETFLLAARYGMSLLEELPGVYVEPHFKTYRLFFDKYHLDFAQAVALMYYLFSAYFSLLRPSIAVKDIDAELVLYMDRFPGASAGGTLQNSAIPKTDGMRFVEYVRRNSPTYLGIEKAHRKDNTMIEFRTLDRWSRLGDQTIIEGKLHPHFKLTDWLVQSAIATSYRGEFIANYTPHDDAIELADTMAELYSVFKSFNIWSMGHKAMSHIKAEKQQWGIPDEAKRFILGRAGRW